MLVLSRKDGQKLFIGNDIIITITKTQTGRVSLGIDAPKTTKIIREELLDTIINENRTVAKSLLSIRPNENR